MKKATYFILLFISSYLFTAFSIFQNTSMNQSDIYLKLSENLVEYSRDKKDATKIIEQLGNVSPDLLANELFNDVRKKTFWINIYNGYVQLILQKNPEKFEDRSKFYSEKQIRIAQQMLSFDDIEHGIIRGSKVKLALGILKDPFANNFEKKFRVDETDGRIHFALNCGAKSCPYVAVYNYLKFEDQINLACKLYLKKVTTIDGNKVKTSALFSWFRGDFGGLDGVSTFLKTHQIIPDSLDAEIHYDDYDWTLELGNFMDI